MKHRNDKIFERWLVAESDGRDAVAEQALRRMFGGLPSLSPSTGFADRVMAAAISRRPLPWWSRAAVAACLLLAGLAVALILPLAFSLFRIIAPGDVIGALVQGFVAAASRIDELFSLWQVWARIVDTALLIATAPPVVLSLLTLTALSVFTFRGLKRALEPYRSPDHVPA